MTEEKIIYWHKHDIPEKHYNPFIKKDIEIFGEFRCRDERVDKVWFTEGFHPLSTDNQHIQYSLHLLFKNGERKDFRTDKLPINEYKSHDVDPLIVKAEQYLQSINK